MEQTIKALGSYVNAQFNMQCIFYQVSTWDKNLSRLDIVLLPGGIKGVKEGGKMFSVLNVFFFFTAHCERLKAKWGIFNLKNRLHMVMTDPIVNLWTVYMSQDCDLSRLSGFISAVTPFCYSQLHPKNSGLFWCRHRGHTSACFTSPHWCERLPHSIEWR